MAERQLKSLNNNKKRILNAVLKTGEIKSIKGFRKQNPEYEDDASAWAYLLELYNQGVKNTNQARKTRLAEEKRVQKANEKKYVMDNVFVIQNKDSNLSTLRSALVERKGKSVVVQLMDNKKVYQSKQYTIDENAVSWWRKNNGMVYLDFQYDSDFMLWDIYPSSKLYIYTENVRINPTKIRQSFREGITNCLLVHISSWVEEKIEESKSKRTQQRYEKLQKDVGAMMNQYINGVPEDEVPIICDKLQIDIDITAPFGKKPLLECKSTKKALRKFRYMNTRLNHVELNELVNEDNVIEIATHDELNAVRNELDSSGTYYTYNKGFNGLTEISTLYAKYKLSNEYMTAVREFEDQYNLGQCKIDDIHDKELSRFVRSGTHYNGTIDFQPDITQQYQNELIPSFINHIDVRKAYTQYEHASYYNGFLGKITDFRETDKVEGVGMYLITDLKFNRNIFQLYNEKMVMYENDNIYTDAELKMLDDNDVSYKILGGCWGVSPLEFDFTEDMLNKRDELPHKKGEKAKTIPFYSKWCGACNSLRTKRSFWMKGSSEMAGIIAENCDGVVRNYWNGEIQIEYNQPNATHLSHITAFILAYMRINMIEQLLTMDPNTIVRVCCDGIYFTGEQVELNSIFAYKEKKTFSNPAGDAYCSHLNEEKQFGFGKARKHNRLELHLGEGGSGKTHYNLTDTGLVKPMFIAPSWKLARAKQRELGVHCSVWARAISDDPDKINLVRRYANTLIWDEVSMMTEGQKKFIFETYPDMKNIFCGDLGFQLPCIEGEPLEPTGFDEIFTHTQDHRCKCPILKEIKVTLREMIEAGADKREINKWVVNRFHKIGRVIDNAELKKRYDICDMILVGTNSLKDLYTNMFAGKFYEGEGDERVVVEKYYITSNNRLYSNGEIVIDSTKPEKTDCEMRHAFTTHSIQGETAQHKLFIESSRMFDSRMFYTAISRAKTIDQIFIVETSAEIIKGARQMEIEKRLKKIKKEGCEKGDKEEITDMEEYSKKCENACRKHMGSEAFDKKINEIECKKLK